MFLQYIQLDTRTHPLGLFWTSHQPAAEATT